MMYEREWCMSTSLRRRKCRVFTYLHTNIFELLEYKLYDRGYVDVCVYVCDRYMLLTLNTPSFLHSPHFPSPFAEYLQVYKICSGSIVTEARLRDVSRTRVTMQMSGGGG